MVMSVSDILKFQVMGGLGLVCLWYEVLVSAYFGGW